MGQNNTWYLDRGKNFFTDEGKLFFEEMISIFNSLSIYILTSGLFGLGIFKR